MEIPGLDPDLDKWIEERKQCGCGLPRTLHGRIRVAAGVMLFVLFAALSIYVAVSAVSEQPSTQASYEDSPAHKAYVATHPTPTPPPTPTPTPSDAVVVEWSGCFVTCWGAKPEWKDFDTAREPHVTGGASEVYWIRPDGSRHGKMFTCSGRQMVAKCGK